MSKNLDANAQSGGRVRRNWANINKGGATALIGTSPPIVINGSNQVALQLATTGGLTVVGATLAMLLDTNPGLALSASGLKVVLNGTSLTLGASGLSLNGALTTKGDLYTFSTTPIRFGVGSNGQFLIADSTQTAGIKWGSSVSNITITAALVSNGTAAFNGNVSFNSGVSFTTLTATADGSSFAGTTIKNVSTATSPLVMDTPSFQVADLQVWKNFGTVKANMSASGLLTVTGLSVSSSVQGDITFAGNATISGALTLSNATTTHGVGDAATSVLSSGFTITAAAGTYQDTGLSTSLPAAGTYLVSADIRSELVTANLSTGQANFVVAKLFNATDSADVANSERMVQYTANSQTASIVFHTQVTAPMNVIVTVAGAKTINLYAKRDGDSTATTATIQSSSAGRSTLGYRRIA